MTLIGVREDSAQPESNMENVTPEYQMAYFNNILLYYILRAVTNEQLAKDIWEEARKQAFPQIEEEKENGKTIL